MTKMIGFTAGKAIVVALAALASGAAIVSCSHRDSSRQPTPTGSVDFSLMIRTGVIINTVDYKITGNGIAMTSGKINVSSANSARALVAGIPVGTGYVATLNAVSLDGKTNCLGMATFNVVEGQTAQAMIVMQCKGPGAGSLSIGGTFDNCPILSMVMATPQLAAVNGTIMLQAKGSDPDLGDSLTYLWSQSPPSSLPVSPFMEKTSANTIYSCLAPGSFTLTISATDGTCTANVSLPVCCGAAGSCVSGTGGASGTGGSGGGGATGTGGSGTSTGGKSTGGSSTGGSGTGGAAGATSGAGGAAGGVGGGSGIGGNAGGGGAGGRAGGGGAVGRAGGGGTSGGGTSGGGTSGGGAGGAAGGAGGSVSMCTMPPTHCVVASCETCTTDNCFPATDGCDLITDPVDKQLCEDTYACFVAPAHPGSTVPGPCTSMGDPTQCWCGTNPTTCLTDTAAANGPCRNLVVAAAKSSDPGTIKLRFVDPGFPLGRAVNLSSCRGSFCSGCDPSSPNCNPPIEDFHCMIR